VSPEAILQPHFASTMERIRQASTVVLVQDTTELDVTRPYQQVVGAGPMDSKSRFGGFYHPLVAFDESGLPLGSTWRKTWTRESIETELSASEKSARRKHTSIEEKESMRWIEGLREARRIADVSPGTHCICVADSEADIYEYFAEPRSTSHGLPLDLIVRGCQDRALRGKKEHLLAVLRKEACIARSTVHVSRRQPKIAGDTRNRKTSRDARIAEVEVRSKSVVLRAPWRPDRKLPDVEVNVVLVEEVDPPAGEAPIQWLLITTLPIQTADEAQKVVEYYCIRWQIEVFFRTLKSGCRIESRYFERMQRLLNCIAVYTIVAWRILYLCRLSRECPDIDCEAVFTPGEWKSVYMAVRRQAPPEKPPSLNEIVRMIASLGGYVVRKSTEPGTQTLWLGLQRLYDLSTAWDAFGPDTRT
jgi:hypothetical protein